MSTTTYGEGFQPAVPIWVNVTDPWQKNLPKNHLAILQGEAVIKEIKRSPIEHAYSINALSTTLLKENTLYFPNWTLFANNKEVAINYKNPTYPGIITFKLPKGVYSVKLIFLPTKIRIISQWISIISGILFCLFSIYALSFRLKQKK